MSIGERHLGLTTPSETGRLGATIAEFGNVVAGSVDLHRLKALATSAPEFEFNAPPETQLAHDGLRIGIAQDVSFGFYYPDDLEAFRAHGATLVPFDTTSSSTLPDIDGLFIGGGFPEIAMDALGANRDLRDDIKSKIEAGLPTYAECGGLMYLCRSLKWDERSSPMCGVIDADAIMNARPQGRGYTGFDQGPDHPWGLAKSGLRAHEFHHARIDGLPRTTTYARSITRGHGLDGKNDGVVIHNLLAGFIHLRNCRSTPWVTGFLDFVATKKYAKK